jgi:hypothetical protein
MEEQNTKIEKNSEENGKKRREPSTPVSRGFLAVNLQRLLLMPATQLLRCQYWYFCTSKASKLSTFA